MHILIHSTHHSLCSIPPVYKVYSLQLAIQFSDYDMSNTRASLLWANKPVASSLSMSCGCRSQPAIWTLLGLKFQTQSVNSNWITGIQFRPSVPNLSLHQDFKTDKIYCILITDQCTLYSLHYIVYNRTKLNWFLTDLRFRVHLLCCVLTSCQ